MCVLFYLDGADNARARREREVSELREKSLGTREESVRSRAAVKSCTAYKVHLTTSDTLQILKINYIIFIWFAIKYVFVEVIIHSVVELIEYKHYLKI